MQPSARLYLGAFNTNHLLDSEAKIFDIINSRHPYDILSFDFAKAFDKAPHYYVIETATFFGICSKALEWLACFLTCRTFRVRVGNALSASVDVTSGVIQGSTLGPVLYDTFIDSLLRKIILPSQAFAGDFKFKDDVITHSKDIIQNEINIAVDWADERGTPLSKGKCCALHCGPVQPYNFYYIKSAIIKANDTIIDLGIKSSCDSSFSEHCNSMILKALRTCGLIRHIFPSGHRNMLWSAFQIYVLPILSYCSPLWSPFLKRDIDAVEAVQRAFTKRICSLKNLPYNDRLHELGTLILSNRRTLTDLVTVYKYLHGLINCLPSDVGLETAISSTRGCDIRLKQKHPVNQSCANLYPFRAASTWNKLPLHLLKSGSVKGFIKGLRRHLLSGQT